MHISHSDPWHEDETGTFTATFNHYYHPLVFFARKLLHDATAAEDIVTEIFLKYWQKQNNFNSLPAIKTFLYISTRNACLNYLQRASYQARAKTALLQTSDDNDDFVLNEITRAEV